MMLISFIISSIAVFDIINYQSVISLPADIFLLVLGIGNMILSLKYPEIFNKKGVKMISNATNNKAIFFYTKQDISWEELKKTINQYYQPLGYTDVTVDADSSFMIKNPKEENSYIFATMSGDDIKVEVFNAPKFDGIKDDK